MDLPDVIAKLQEQARTTLRDRNLKVESEGDDVWRVPVHKYPDGRVVTALLTRRAGVWRVIHYGQPCMRADYRHKITGIQGDLEKIFDHMSGGTHQ